MQAVSSGKTVLSAKPLLKWAGGKRWLIEQIRDLWQSVSSRRLVEPFCGGLAIALGLHLEHALLNDVNPHLINFYQQVQRGLTVDFEMIYDKDRYYAARDSFNENVRSGEIATPEMAQIFYYMNRSGFNGLCRFNRKGEFNVPFGRYKTVNYAQNFDAYTDIFQGWTFTSQDFEQIGIEDGDFLYVDPPYDVEFTSYAKADFTWSDQVRLVEWLAQFAQPMVISNQATDRILALYRDYGFEIDLLKAPRRISSNGDRRPAIEVLATRNLKQL